MPSVLCMHGVTPARVVREGDFKFASDMSMLAWYNYTVSDVWYLLVHRSSMSLSMR